VRRALALVWVALSATATATAAADEVTTGQAVVARAPRAGAVPTTGPRTALVTVELFCNLGHAQCTATLALLRELSARHPGGLRTVYRQVAATFRDSQIIAETTFEAWAQGRFTELLDVAAASAGPLRVRDLDATALRAGLDLDGLHAALADHRHAAAVSRDGLDRERLNAGNFALVWNGVPQSPDLGAAAFERAFTQAADRARLLLAEGVPIERVYPLLAADAARARLRAAVASIDPTAPRVRVPTDGAPIRGADSAAVTIVVFSEFDCPFCRHHADIMDRIVLLYPDRVRVAWKHLPLPFHPSANKAAELGACAALQGRFWELYDALVTPGARLFAADLERAVDKAGLDRDRLHRDLASGRCAARIEADMADARAANVDTAPTIFVNGLRLVGAQGLSSLRQVVDAELAPGLLEELTASPP